MALLLSTMAYPKPLNAKLSTTNSIWAHCWPLNTRTLYTYDVPTSEASAKRTYIYLHSLHSQFSCYTKLWLIKLKLAPLLIKPWTLLAKELEENPTSSKSNCCRRVLGCHPHSSCAGKALGMTWSRLKHVVADEVCALNRQYGVGPACDSLDHRAGAC